MFKKFLKIISSVLILIILFISYLSIFGIKTDKFNDVIVSKIEEQDNRISIDIKDVFFKLNIIERSISLNSKDVTFYIQKHKQQISNINLLIDLESFFRKDNKIKKIIINSQENKIKNLFKFIRSYKVNIPTIYLDNIVSKGDIIYDVIISFNGNNSKKIEIAGKIFDMELLIFGKEKIENVNLNFRYNNQILDIIDSKLIFKGLNFSSNNISVKNKNNSFIIQGDFKNKINSNLLSKLFNYDIKSYLKSEILQSSESKFNLKLGEKFKIKDYSLQTKVFINNIPLAVKDSVLKKYITNLKDQITLKKGELILNINKKNKIELKINSNYILNKNEPNNLNFIYTKKNSIENYDLNIDLSENEISIKKINFLKKENDNLTLALLVTKKNNEYVINSCKLFNNDNSFDLQNIVFSPDFKIKDFSSIEAKYINKDNFLNNIIIKKNNNKIKLNAKNLDISYSIEKALTSSDKENFFDIFQNLNSSIYLDINVAKLDNDHSLKALNGKIVIKKNTIDKANLFGKFNDKDRFIFTKKELEGNKITTIYSDIAEPFVKKFSFVKGFEGGKLDFISTKVNQNSHKSELKIYDFKLKNMPTLTKLLSLASLQGIADLATGEGIRFSEFDMFFNNSKNLITIDEIYALGPAISILMEGYVEKNKLVSLRGTMVPATTINKTIAKIPLLGDILVGDKIGEGVFGVSFKIKGPPKNLDTRVNPIKTLTPRFITRTLEKIKKSN